MGKEFGGISRIAGFSIGLAQTPGDLHTPCNVTTHGLGRLITAKAWKRASQVRRDCFENGNSLFVDPAWEIVLHLYIEAAEGREVAVGDLCLASNVPATTALRWIDRLVHERLAVRTEARRDGCGAFVQLSEQGRCSVEQALDAAVEGDRKLGVGRLEPLQ